MTTDRMKADRRTFNLGLDMLTTEDRRKADRRVIVQVDAEKIKLDRYGPFSYLQEDRRHDNRRRDNRRKNE